VTEFIVRVYSSYSEIKTRETEVASTASTYNRAETTYLERPTLDAKYWELG